MSASSTTTTNPFGLTAQPVATGNVFYVSSTEAGRSDSPMHGRDPHTPFATLAYALGQCTANIGDTVQLMEGHVETIITAGGLTFAFAGIRVLGLGVGENRPLLRLTASTGASIAISNSDIRIENVVIDATQLDGIANVVTVNGEDVTLVDCTFYLGDLLGQAVLGVVTTTNANRLTLERCRFFGSADAGPDAFVKIVGTPSGLRIADCWFLGRAVEALIWNDTGNVATDLLIQDCTLRALSGSAAIKLESAVTGIIRDVAMSGTTLVGIYDPGACASINVEGYDEGAADSQAQPLPQNGTTLANGRSIYDELLGATINAGRLNSFVVTADFTSADWNTVAAHAIAVVTGCVRMRIVPVCTDSLVSGGAPTMQFGHAGETTSMILSTDPLSILTDTLWLSITPKKAQMYLALIDQILSDTSVGYEVFVAAMTGGEIEFTVWWEPLSEGATVTAGTGASF